MWAYGHLLGSRLSGAPCFWGEVRKRVRRTYTTLVLSGKGRSRLQQVRPFSRHLHMLLVGLWLRYKEGFGLCQSEYRCLFFVSLRVRPKEPHRHCCLLGMPVHASLGAAQVAMHHVLFCKSLLRSCSTGHRLGRRPDMGWLPHL